MGLTTITKTTESKIILDLKITENSYEFDTNIGNAISEAEIEISTLNERIESIDKLKPNCDKLDYILAASSGALCGMIDIFLVGVPKDSELIKFTDEWFSNRTIDFANLCAPEGKKYTDLKSAIEFLEKTFPVPFDQTTIGEAGKKLFNLTPKNHHFKSLSHNPSLYGLFCSIMDQLYNTSHFVSDEKLIILEKAEKYWDLNNTWASKRLDELLKKFDSPFQKETLPIKIISGFINWFGHLISDLSGSTSSAHKGNRGMGIPSPLWTLINDIVAIKSELNISKTEIERTMGDLAIKIFENGYDFRFQSTQAIPVIINELLVRFLYSFRRLFKYFKNTKAENRSFSLMWQQCEPFSNVTVKRMLTVAHGTFCLFDAADATIRALVSGKGKFNGLEFFLRLNIVGVGRFTISLYGETKRIFEYNRTKKDAIFAQREKVIVEDYLKGLKILEQKYSNNLLSAFIKDFENSELYIDNFKKSILLAEGCNVPSNKILKSKADIDKYFGGKNND